MASYQQVPYSLVENAALVLAGAMANWGLYGVLVSQIYLYTVSFPNDRFIVKGIVYLTLVLETVQNILIIHDSFKLFTVEFAESAALSTLPVGTAWFAVPLTTGIIASLTQLFYCLRIGILTKSRLAVAIIASLSLVQLGGAIAAGNEMLHARFYGEIFLNSSSFMIAGIWTGGSAVCDLIIAGIMVSHLKRKENTGFRRTHQLISRIIWLTIETGSATAALSLVVMVLAFLPGHPPYYQAFAIVLGKAYSNSMMVLLNSRIKVVPNFQTGAWNEKERSDIYSIEETEFSIPARRCELNVLFSTI